MRKTKFRVWNRVMKSKEGFMTYSKSYNRLSSFFIDSCESPNGQINKKYVKLMEFTGLRDKNGKEIYEGDVITWFADGIDKKAVVQWGDDGGYIAERFDRERGNAFDHKFKFQSFIPVRGNEFDGEVIGNIYENPELLSESTREANKK